VWGSKSDKEGQAHNLKVIGSNPIPATKLKDSYVNDLVGFFFFLGQVTTNAAGNQLATA
jgi:hypothetical protein